MSKIRGKKGFSFAELIVTLAIMSIMLAIAVPPVVSISRKSLLFHLDTNAGTIFLASQHRLTNLSGTTSYKNLRDVSKDSPYGDFDYTVFDENSDNEIAEFISETLDGGSVVLEYAGYSASAAGVYYSEKMSAEELEKTYLTQDLSDKNIRAKLMIGYHGGEPSRLKPGHIYNMEPHIDVHNGEDLFLTVSVSDYPDVPLEKLKVELNLFQSLDGAPFYSESSNLAFEDGEYTCKFLLDSVGKGPTHLTIGDGSRVNSTVFAAVTVKCDVDGETYRTPYEVSLKTAVEFDPFFEHRDEDGTVYISKVRHLDNLRYFPYYNAVQSDDICFKGVDGKEFFDGRTKDISIEPIPRFYGTFDGDYNNDIHFIKNMSLTTAGENFGLFESLYGTVKNLHITGDSCLETGGAINAGIICSKLEKGEASGEPGLLNNCTASGLSITLGENVKIFGGLAGICEGKIEKCSAVLGDVTIKGTDVKAGGIAGKLDGGEIISSHSGGRFSSDNKSQICGIANAGVGGLISKCYSECSVKSISGSEVYGISDSEYFDSLCVSECSWLAQDYSESVSYDNLILDGYENTNRFYKQTELWNSSEELLETVTAYGTEIRFGEKGIVTPRGLIGIMKSEYSDGKYDYKIMGCFDAYGNDCLINYPEIEWENPSDGEVRYYFFRTASASPQGCTDGWEWSADGKTGDESVSTDGRYVFCRVEPQTVATLRFGKIEREYEFEELTEDLEDAEGYVGAIAIQFGTNYDLFTFEPTNIIVFQGFNLGADKKEDIIYYYEDFANQSNNIPNEVQTLESYPFTDNDLDKLGITNYYVFISKNLAINDEDVLKYWNRSVDGERGDYEDYDYNIIEYGDFKLYEVASFMDQVEYSGIKLHFNVAGEDRMVAFEVQSDFSGYYPVLDKDYLTP